ncbi:hypothetical protein CY34DRAFT_135027 [Suillus luteus UH-Slu-Lm8-n1]|uniref:Uncharacterized protein n=1 Tax=Suillus luteus UH-Slu-Lm8-n1 TaxID=930992 RepID=A0A0C9ZY46_9AGAM|nr:hypothetical protein CY34DRAFT_135027 [Suillus luteus UH-Slu-Lm8-n1]
MEAVRNLVKPAAELLIESFVPCYLPKYFSSQIAKVHRYMASHLQQRPRPPTPLGKSSSTHHPPTRTRPNCSRTKPDAVSTPQSLMHTPEFDFWSLEVRATSCFRPVARKMSCAFGYALLMSGPHKMEGDFWEIQGI